MALQRETSDLAITEANEIDTLTAPHRYFPFACSSRWVYMEPMPSAWDSRGTVHLIAHAIWVVHLSCHGPWSLPRFHGTSEDPSFGENRKECLHVSYRNVRLYRPADSKKKTNVSVTEIQKNSNEKNWVSKNGLTASAFYTTRLTKSHAPRRLKASSFPDSIC